MEEEIKPDLAFFYNLDYENKTCFDCKGAFPHFISVNNAIILCQSCAQLHKELGYNASFIREVNDDWDPYLLSFILRGGNGRLIRFFNDYKLNELPIQVKYKTKAAEYYRKLILSEVNADSPPEPILMDVALDECFNTIYFPEFDNYTIFKGEKQQKSSQTRGISGKILQSLYTVGEGLENATQYIGETVTKPEVKNTIINGGTATYEGIKTTGEIIYDYSQPVVSFIANKTIQGFGYLYGKIANGVNEYQNKKFKMNTDEDNESNAKGKSNDINNNTYTHVFNNNEHCHSHNHNQCNNCYCNMHSQNMQGNHLQYSTLQKLNNNLNDPMMMSQIMIDKTPPIQSIISTSKITHTNINTNTNIPSPTLKIEQMNSLAIDTKKDKEKIKKKRYKMSPCKENPTYEVIVRDKKPKEINKKEENINNINKITLNNNNNSNPNFNN